jgi:ATP-dependent helicase Lhr and Lhr-like helicase
MSAPASGLGVGVVAATLQRLALGGRVVEGEFRPGGHGREWCDAEVLRTMRRRSLARLRQEVEPVEPQVLGRFLTAVARHRSQAAGSMRCSTWSSSCRVRRWWPRCSSRRSCRPAWSSATSRRCSTRWSPPARCVGGRRAARRARRAHRAVPHRSPEGARATSRDGRPGRPGGPRGTHRPGWPAARRLVLRPAARSGRRRVPPGDRGRAVVARLEGTGDQRHTPPLRAYAAAPENGRRPGGPRPSARGGWCRPLPRALDGLVGITDRATPTEWAAAITEQLLTRHGVVTRDVTSVEPLPAASARSIRC